MKKIILLLTLICFLATGLKAQCPPPPTPSICMVTCDNLSINNIIYWDKTGLTHVDSFIIYRETSPAVYSKIGAVSNDSLSQYTDTARSIGPANGDPNIASYRYKIRILDSCGVYSAMSPYHNTIYIVDDGLGDFSWSIPYGIEGSSSPVINYVLLCDTAGVGVWGPVSTVLGADTIASDPGFVSHSSVANWRVKTAWGISCTPTHASINTTRSNIKHAASLTTGLSAAELSRGIKIYPNPANEFITIESVNEFQQTDIKIINVLGENIFEENVSSSGANRMFKQVDIHGYAKGIYMICIESNNVKVFKKLVIN